jgi:hypothetical protein
MIAFCLNGQHAGIERDPLRTELGLRFRPIQPPAFSVNSRPSSVNSQKLQVSILKLRGRIRERLEGAVEESSASASAVTLWSSSGSLTTCRLSP